MAELSFFGRTFLECFIYMNIILIFNYGVKGLTLWNKYQSVL